MTGYQPNRPRHDAAGLDELIDSAMSGILAKLDPAFDPDAGLADIYARCGTHPAGARPDSPGTDRPRPRRSTPTLGGHPDIPQPAPVP